MLITMFMVTPTVVRADLSTLELKCDTDTAGVGDFFEVDLLSYSIVCAGDIHTTLNYDSNVLELINDDISSYTISKNIESDNNGSYNVIYKFDACENEGIDPITQYRFKVKSDNVSTTAISIDSYMSFSNGIQSAYPFRTINVNIEKAKTEDGNHDNNINNDKTENMDQSQNNVQNNDNFMDYLIVTLLGVVILLLLILICVTVSRKRKENK